jgi:predicted short-subunit dehydrogenase-like oxidoreductase (DUF2520 family)
MRITLIGSGNVATHLGAALKNTGHHIVQVYSRDQQNAALLAYHLKAEPVNVFDALHEYTDVFIISIKDDAIEGAAAALAHHQKPILHTSGATPLKTLLKFTDQAGVLYPLQTFSKTRELNFRTVPLCVEGAFEDLTIMIKDLAMSISNNVYDISSDQRKILHLAAVFACNFPNYLYNIAGQQLAHHDIAFDLIRPLILETALKVQDQLPYNVQTGPAIRNDQNTMQAHLQLLSDNADLQNIYESLSQGIIKMGKG